MVKSKQLRKILDLLENRFSGFLLNRQMNWTPDQSSLSPCPSLHPSSSFWPTLHNSSNLKRQQPPLPPPYGEQLFSSWSLPSSSFNVSRSCPEVSPVNQTCGFEWPLLCVSTRDRPLCFFQDWWRLLVNKEADNWYLEQIYMCSKNESLKNNLESPVMECNKFQFT